MQAICEQSAYDDGWFLWCGAWFHVYPWEISTLERPPYFIGTVRDLCLMHGLKTGDTEL